MSYGRSDLCNFAFKTKWNKLNKYNYKRKVHWVVLLPKPLVVSLGTLKQI